MALPFPTLALDFTTQDLRIAYVARRRSRAEIASLIAAPLPAHTVVGGVIEKPADVTAALTALLHDRRYAHLPRHALFLLPDALCFVFTISLKPDEENVPEALRWEAAQHLPFDIQGVYLDWELVHSTATESRYQVAAAPREVVEQYLSVLDASHLTPVSASPASLATLSALDLSTVQQPTIVLLLEAASSTLTLVDAQSVLFTMQTSAFSEQRLIDLLKEKLRLSPKEAQKALRLYGIEHPTSRNAVAQTVSVQLKELVKSIEQLQSYAATHAAPVQSLVLTGGGSALKGLGEQLHKRLNISTTTHPFDPSLVYAQRTDDAPAEEDVPAFSSVIGLGFSAL